MATDKRAAERRLEDLLMAMGRHRRDREAYSNKGDAAGEERCDRLLKINYSLLRSHCAKHDLELPHNVPPEGAA